MSDDQPSRVPGLTIKPGAYGSPRSTNALAMRRAMEAWNLRVVGVGWDEIAKRVGYHNASNAQRAIKRFLGTLPDVNIEEARHLWRQRLEFLFGHAALDVMQQRPGAIRAATGVAARAAEFDGLDKARQVEFKIDLTNPDHFSEVLRQLGIELVEEGDPFRQIDVIDADVIDDDDESDDDEDDDQ